MTTTKSPARHNAAVEHYSAQLYCEAVRALARRRRHDDAEDIALDVVEQFLAQPQQVMDRYVDAAHYALVAIGHAAIAFDRRQRVQRGEGVRLVRGADGLLAPHRHYTAGNVPCIEGGDELLDTVVDRAEPVDEQATRARDTQAMLAQCLLGVPAADRELLLLVDGVGYTVREAAGLLGQRRETVSRHVNRIRRRVRANGRA